MQSSGLAEVVAVVLVHGIHTTAEGQSIGLVEVEELERSGLVEVVVVVLAASIVATIEYK